MVGGKHPARANHLPPWMRSFPGAEGAPPIGRLEGRVVVLPHNVRLGASSQGTSSGF